MVGSLIAGGTGARSPGERWEKALSVDPEILGLLGRHQGLRERSRGKDRRVGERLGTACDGHVDGTQRNGVGGVGYGLGGGGARPGHGVGGDAGREPGSEHHLPCNHRRQGGRDDLPEDQRIDHLGVEVRPLDQLRHHLHRQIQGGEVVELGPRLEERRPQSCHDRALRPDLGLVSLGIHHLRRLENQPEPNDLYALRQPGLEAAEPAERRIMSGDLMVSVIPPRSPTPASTPPGDETRSWDPRPWAIFGAALFVRLLYLAQSAEGPLFWARRWMRATTTAGPNSWPSGTAIGSEPFFARLCIPTFWGPSSGSLGHSYVTPRVIQSVLWGP